MPLPSEPQPALGNALRELRAEAGISQEELAHRASLTVGTVSVIERGRSNPTWATLKALVNALEVSMTELAARTEKFGG
jgi:transcriptional regulator with XRE-family HTH domain